MFLESSMESGCHEIIINITVGFKITNIKENKFSS